MLNALHASSITVAALTLAIAAAAEPDSWPMPIRQLQSASASADASGIPSLSVVRVDLLELNHCYDCEGRHKFDQLILWEWSPDYCRYHVVGWWLPSEPLCQVLDGTVVRHGGKIYQAQVQRETWTVGWDPEVENRKLFPCEHRRGL